MAHLSRGSMLNARIASARPRYLDLGRHGCPRELDRSSPTVPSRKMIGVDNGDGRCDPAMADDQNRLALHCAGQPI